MKNLTQEQMQNIKDTCGMYHCEECYCGQYYVVYMDLSLTLSHVYQIKGEEKLYCDEQEVKDILKDRFMKENEHRTIYVVAHTSPHENSLHYEETFRLGEEYVGYDLYSAVWYNSKESLLDYLKNKNLCLNDTVLLEYDILYLQYIINNEEALESIRKVIR